MVSDRMRRRLEALLDEADDAATAQSWKRVAEAARAALAIEADNADALTFLRMAEANDVSAELVANDSVAEEDATLSASTRAPATKHPSSLAGGLYEVRHFLGDGGKKRVFFSHDTQLDRDVAFSLIKTEGLDDTGTERITREAQSMGRLGSSPHIVTIYEIGTEARAAFRITRDFVYRQTELWPGEHQASR